MQKLAVSKPTFKKDKLSLFFFLPTPPIPPPRLQCNVMLLLQIIARMDTKKFKGSFYCILLPFLCKPGGTTWTLSSAWTLSTVKPQPTSVSSKAHKEHGAAAGHTTWNQRAKGNVVNSYLSAFRDMLVMEVQEAKSRCLSLEQNLLRLVHVLEENTWEILTWQAYAKPYAFHTTRIILPAACTSLAFP